MISVPAIRAFIVNRGVRYITPDLFDALMAYRELCLTLPKEDWDGVIGLMCTVYPNATRLIHEVYVGVPMELLYIPRFKSNIRSFEKAYDEWFDHVLLRYLDE